MKALFIVGYWNSGTTLLVDVLRHHPDLELRRARWKPNLEERTIRKILNRLGADFIELGDYSEVIKHGFVHYQEPEFNEAQYQQFKQTFERKFWVREPKCLLLKNPWLFFMPNFIEEQFKECQIKKLMIIRQGTDQVVSKDYWKRKTKTEAERVEKLRARAQFWVRAMEYYFEYWHDQADTLTIRYENLCLRPSFYFERICQFMGMEFKDFAHKVPQQLSNRQTLWQELPANYQQMVLEIVEDMQEKIDRKLPVALF